MDARPWTPNVPQNVAPSTARGVCDAAVHQVSHLLTAVKTGVFQPLNFFLLFYRMFVKFCVLLVIIRRILLIQSVCWQVLRHPPRHPSRVLSQAAMVIDFSLNSMNYLLTYKRLQLWLTINRPSLVSNTSVFLLQREAVPPSPRTARSPVWTSTPVDVSSALVRQTQVKFLFQKEFYMVKGKPVIFFGNF